MGSGSSVCSGMRWDGGRCELPLYQSELSAGSGKFALQRRGTWDLLGRGTHSSSSSSKAWHGMAWYD